MTATAAQTKQRPWWLTLVLGIAAIIVGGLLLWGSLVTKVQTYLLLVEVLGIWWLVDGIFDIVSLFVDRTAWAWKLFIGIVSIIAGGYILMYPVLVAAQLPQLVRADPGHLGRGERNRLALPRLPGRRLARGHHGRHHAHLRLHPHRELWRAGLGSVAGLGRSGVRLHRRLLHGLPGLQAAEGVGA